MYWDKTPKIVFFFQRKTIINVTFVMKNSSGKAAYECIAKNTKKIQKQGLYDTADSHLKLHFHNIFIHNLY